MRHERRERRDTGVVEPIAWMALGALVLAAGYLFVWRPSQAEERKLTPEEQAYVAAVATQQADAYLRAVATAQAAQPPAPPPPPAPQKQSAPPAPTQPPQQPAPPPPSPPPAPTPTLAPPPPPPSKAAMSICVGYMMGYTGATGLSECQQIAAAGDNVGQCVGHIIAGTAKTSGKGICVEAALDAGGNLGDCLLGLSGQSHFGSTSCRIYYETH